MFYKIIQFILTLFFKLFYRFTVERGELPLETPLIIAPNHASFLDPPAIGVAHPTPLHFFARKTLFDNRLLAWIMKALHAEPIAKGAEGAKALVRARKLLKEGKSVVLFPEGTRSRGGKILPLNKGVVNLSLKSGVPILPIYLSGTYEAWPPEKKWPKFSGDIQCIYGKAIDPVEYSDLPKHKALDAMLDDLYKALTSMQNGGEGV